MQKPTEPDIANLVSLGLYAVFAGVGGMLGYLIRTIQSGGIIKWPRAVLEGFSAGFLGLVVTFICEALTLNSSWTGAIVGVSGWMGASASAKVVELLVARRLGITSAELKQVEQGNIAQSK